MSKFQEFETLKRSSKPNNYLVAPDGICTVSMPDRASPVFDDSPDEMFERLNTIIGQTPGFKSLQALDGNRLTFIAVTALLRFKDDVQIAVLPCASPDQCQLAIYSASRVGHSDLGANRKRVEKLLSFL